MKRARERRLDAFRDGELAPRARERVQRSLTRDPDAARRVDDTERLGRAVRSAWSEGPPVPSADYLIAVLRPELRRIDRELEEEVGALSRLLGRLRLAVQPGPAGALAAACALALFLALPTLFRGRGQRDRGVRSNLRPGPERSVADDPAGGGRLYRDLGAR